MVSKLCIQTWSRQLGILQQWFKEGMISSWPFFWLVSTEVGGSQYHQPSGSNWILGSSAYEQYTFNSSHLMRVSVFVKQLKILLCISHEGKPRLPQDCTVYLNMSCWNSGKFMEVVINNWGTQEDFCDQEPDKFLLIISIRY